MVIPAIAALLARIVGSRLIGAVAARVVGARAATAALTRLPLVPLERVRAASAVAGNRIVGSLRGMSQAATTAPRSFSNVIGNVFARQPTPPGQRPPTVVQRIQNFFRGGPQGPPQAPPGAVRAVSTITGNSISGAPGAAIQQAQSQQQQQAAQSQIASQQQQASVSRQVVEGMVKWTSVLGLLTVTSKKLAEVQLEAQSHLVHYNVVIANAFNKMKIAEVRRNIASGARTEESTAMLAQAVTEMNNELQPVLDLATNFFNTALTLAAYTIATQAKIAGYLLKIFNVIPKVPQPQAQGNNTWEASLRRLADWSRKHRMPIQRPNR